MQCRICSVSQSVISMAAQMSELFNAKSTGLRMMSLEPCPVVYEIVGSSFHPIRPTIDHTDLHLAPSAESVTASVRVWDGSFDLIPRIDSMLDSGEA